MTLQAILAAVLTLYCAGLLFWQILRHSLLRKQTCVLDLQHLGSSRNGDQKIHGTAVICGGSLAGLFAARVCHDHFDEVVIVEPEAWADDPDSRRQDAWRQAKHRSRIMQYKSLQGPIQPFAFMALDNLFPNLAKECEASDITVRTSDYRSSTWGRWPKKPYHQYNGTLPDTIIAGRPGLETLIRRLVLGTLYKNIQQLVGTVTGVSCDTSDSARLDRVIIRTSVGSREIKAALVVDCTGPASAGLKWLKRQGYGQSGTYPCGKLPLEKLRITYNQKITYSTFEFYVPPELGNRLPGLPAPYEKCGLIYLCITDPTLDCRCIHIQRTDGNYIQLCCVIFGQIEHPRTLEEIKMYAQSMVTWEPIPSSVFELLDILEEVEDTMTCSHLPFSGASYIRYDKAVNLPANWIATGDSVMKLNPLYGQGVVKALMDAICLNTLLHKHRMTSFVPKDFSTEFFEMQKNKISRLWNANKNRDYSYQSTVPVPGETLSDGWFSRWYTRQIIMLSFDDLQVGSALWNASMMLAPPIDTLEPGIVLKVVWHALKRWVARFLL
ncbi:uncharacterized protein EV420DRAFT_1505043 [Desarmillaria tabescens]|uniref:FAD/NAD(P)-binding domain-containing protein n=1 Tax=Armillaria tabescens TaxID=1929756 RepID=A0AA39TQ95_ARMTA|nr:uncharacterized protein EV420DRAFT_1505043 [Desarmillaria tabescens]KAK0466737.1 hypothetical protein EV420DRAFT_1505043 [Desarmillaria tabescens]